MNALPDQRWADPSSAVDAGKRIDAEIERIAKEISKDNNRVAEILFDADVRADLDIEMIMVCAMNAWVPIEKVSSGQALTRDEEATFPALFRQLRPLFDRREVLIREAAEREVLKWIY